MSRVYPAAHAGHRPSMSAQPELCSQMCGKVSFFIFEYCLFVFSAISSTHTLLPALRNSTQEKRRGEIGSAALSSSLSHWFAVFKWFRLCFSLPLTHTHTPSQCVGVCDFFCFLHSLSAFPHPPTLCLIFLLPLVWSCFICLSTQSLFFFLQCRSVCCPTLLCSVFFCFLILTSADVYLRLRS